MCATNSASACGGITQYSISRCVMPFFFQRPPDGFVADRLDDRQLDDPARQQAQRPVRIALRGRPQTQGDDLDSCSPSSSLGTGGDARRFRSSACSNPSCTQRWRMFGGVAARQGGRLRRGRGPVGTAAAAAALRVSTGALSGSARRRLCVPGAVRLPGCTAAARLRGGDGEQRRVAAARRAGDAGGAGA